MSQEKKECFFPASFLARLKGAGGNTLLVSAAAFHPIHKESNDGMAYDVYREKLSYVALEV
jgi:hypothetical protein